MSRIEVGNIMNGRWRRWGNEGRKRKSRVERVRRKAIVQWIMDGKQCWEMTVLKVTMRIGKWESEDAETEYQTSQY